MIKTILAVIAGVWIVGALSRRSPNHPANALGLQLKFQIGTVPVDPNPNRSFDDLSFPYGPGQETAQIPGAVVMGEGGGE